MDPPSVADLAQMTGLAPERVRQVLDLMALPLSLDAAGGSRLGTTVPDERSASLESQGLAAVQRQEVWAALRRLDPLARQVVGRRFGLLDGVPRALDEVATLFRLPAADVRTLEAAALATLRALLAAPVPPAA